MSEPGQLVKRTMRHSRDSVLVFSRDETAAFLAGTKDGEFDD